MSDDMINMNSSLNSDYSRLTHSNSLRLPYSNDPENQNIINNLANNDVDVNIHDVEVGINNHSHNHHENPGLTAGNNITTTDDFVISQSMLNSFDSERGYTHNDLLEATETAAAAVAATLSNSLPKRMDHPDDTDSNKRGYTDNNNSNDNEDDGINNSKKQKRSPIIDGDLNFKMEKINTTFNQDTVINESGRDISKTNSSSKIIKFTPNRTTENIKKPHLFLTNPNNKKTKREMTKGPPKNSRFFKVYNLDGSKVSKASSIHHYNPYRYPQNRSKLNPNPDFIKNRKDEHLQNTLPNIAGIDNPNFELNVNDSTPKYENDKIPELYPSIDEFEDIYSYIESIKEIGERYGAVKIIPPKEFSPKFAINLESFWIKSNRQLWRTPSDELNSRFEFYTQLKHALTTTTNTSINKLPCIDKRAIDLYRLYRVVNLRGGFENCCNDKLWAQIGRELGFYGKISSSLSSSIKSVYQKYITPWEKLYMDKTSQDFLNLARNDELNSLFSREEFISNTPKVPIIVGSSNPLQRNRQTLIDSGFSTYFDQATTQKKGITLTDVNTLPGYDFYNWNNSNSTDDTIPTEVKISSLYTLKQFYDKSRILKHQLLSKFNLTEHFKFENLDYLEDTFWKLLENPEIMFETEVSLYQSTAIHDSSSENKFLSDKNGNLSDSILGSLNFNNSTISDGSMLQYTNSPSDSLYHSYLNFSMFYGAQAWSAEDHWLYNIDYHYLGDAKSYYVIPPEYQEKYEELLKLHYDIKVKEINRTSETIKLFEKEILNYDIQNACLENQVCFDINLPRSRPNDSRFDKLMEPNTQPVRYNSDIMFSPKFLKENGIPVYHTFQEVGEMIIKFPRSYSSFFSLGTTVTESANIASCDWLEHSLDATKWLQKQNLIPRFSTFSMFLTAARESTDYKTLCSIKPILENLVNEEVRKRNEIRTLMKEVKFNEDCTIVENIEKIQNQISDVIINDTENETVGTKLASKLANLNQVTDADLADIFPTFIMLKHPTNEQSNFTISLDLYLNHRKNESLQLTSYNSEMISLVNDDYLHQSIKDLNDKLETLDQWVEKYNKLVSKNPRPLLNDVKSLIPHGKTLFNEKTIRLAFLVEPERTIYKNFVNLKNEIEKTESWNKKARCILDYNTNNTNKLISFSNFKLLVKEITSLNVVSNEVEEILKMSNEVFEFDSLATAELNKGIDNLDFDELKKLQIVGKNIKIDLESFKLLDKIVKRRLWIDSLKKDISTIEEMKELYERGKLFDSSNQEDIKLLANFKQKIETADKITKEYETFKNDDIKISVQHLIELDKECADLPLPNIKRYVKNLINEQIHLTDDILPLIKIIEEKCKLISNPIHFDKKVELFIRYSDIIARKISTINVEATFKTLSKFKEYENESRIFNEQLIEGPREIFGEINKLFKPLLTFGKDEFKFNNMNESDCLNYLVAYDLDILNSTDGRYCVCRQMHEGNMVECEKCKQWFHFNCIGYVANPESENDDGNKYICPLCDIDFKFPATLKYFTNISEKITFKQLFEFSNKLIESCSISILYENTFLQITDKYYNYYKSSLLNESIARQIDLEDGSKRIIIVEEDVNKLRQLLERIHGCIINYDDIEHVLRSTYYEKTPRTIVTLVEE